jgi:hypothetical protein
MAHGRRAGHETTQRRARRLRSWLPALACCTVVAATCAAPASAAGPAWTGGLELTLPANAYPSAPETVLNSVACPGQGSCAAVGTYTDDAGVDRALAAVQTTGPGWHSSEIDPPAGADSSHPEPNLYSVDCGAPGSCSAVGDYIVATGGIRAMVTTRTNGGWSNAADVELPDHASATPEASLSSVACGAAGSCAAIGFYKDDTDAYRPMGAVQSNGNWSQAVEIDLPANADTTSPAATLLSVACGGPGSCALVGAYEDDTGAFRPMGAVLANGTWSPAVEIDLPGDADVTAPDGYLGTLACPDAGACVAGGSYRDTTGAARAIVASLANGSWSTAAAVTLPTDANATAPGASIDAVACGATGSCGAAGTYADAGGTPRTMVASQTAGSWAAATRLALPADADPAAAGASETAVACGAAGACVLVAPYIDASGVGQRAMTAAQTNGSWSAASALPLPGDAHATNPDAFTMSAACGDRWYCVAVGAYTDKLGTRRALLGTGYPSDPPPTPPTEPPAPAATPAPVTTAPSAALRPIVVLKTSKFTVSKGAIKVKLGCRTADCSGTVKLTTTAKRKTVVLAKASYALVRGRTATISVRLTKAGRKALKHSRARAVRAKLVISIKGGRSTSRTVAVR